MKSLVKQKGAALLAIAVVLLLSMSVLMYSSYSSLNHQRQQSADIQYGSRLKSAREALMAYALTKQQNEITGSSQVKYNRVRLGEMPCPDVSGNGSPNNSGSNCTSLFGWLPWKRLGLPKPTGTRRIWYAVDETFHNRTGTGQEPILNPYVKPSALTLNGNKVVAVLIAEGKPLSTQAKQDIDRPVSNSNKKSELQTFLNTQRALYLEDKNKQANNQTQFKAGASSAVFNDVAISIGQRELMNEVAKVAFVEMRSWFYAMAKEYKFVPFPSEKINSSCGIVKPRKFGALVLTRPPIIPKYRQYGFIPKSCTPSLMVSNQQFFKPFNRDALDNENNFFGWLFRNEWHLFFRYTVGLSNVTGVTELDSAYRYQLFIQPIPSAHWDYGLVKPVAPPPGKEFFYRGRRYKVESINGN